MHNINKKTFRAWLSWKKTQGIYKEVSPEVIHSSLKAQNLSYHGPHVRDGHRTKKGQSKTGV